jgi:hypothetical protein
MFIPNILSYTFITLQFGLAGLLLWSVTGILGMEAEKKANKNDEN